MKTNILFSFCLVLLGCQDLKSEGFLSDNNERLEVNTAKSRLFNLGKTQGDSNQTIIFLAGTNESGEALIPAQLGEATIHVEKNGESVEIPLSDRIFTPFQSADSELASQSIVLNTTKAFNEAELALERLSARQFASELDGLAAFQVLSYSDHVLPSLPFTTDLNDVSASMSRENIPATAGSAHYDALWLSLFGIASADRPIKSSMIFINDRDTGSNFYNKSQIVTITQTLKPFILAIGSKKADIDDMKDLVGSHGAVIYTYEVADSFDAVKNVAKALARGVVIDLGADSVGAESVSVTLSAEQTVDY